MRDDIVMMTTKTFLLLLTFAGLSSAVEGFFIYILSIVIESESDENTMLKTVDWLILFIISQVVFHNVYIRETD